MTFKEYKYHFICSPSDASFEIVIPRGFPSMRDHSTCLAKQMDNVILEASRDLWRMNTGHEICAVFVLSAAAGNGRVCHGFIFCQSYRSLTRNTVTAPRPETKVFEKQTASCVKY